MKTRYKHPLWARYKLIKYHCESESSPRWVNYGGRGIKLHKKWSRDFWAFAEWMENNIGLPTSHRDCLERIDNDGDYKPGNLRWATAKENHNNRTNNTLIKIGRRTQTLTEWCDETDMWISTVLTRMKEYGCTPAEAFGLKPHPRCKPTFHRKPKYLTPVP
jgi:hypothetical protein